MDEDQLAAITNDLYVLTGDALIGDDDVIGGVPSNVGDLFIEYVGSSIVGSVAADFQ